MPENYVLCYLLNFRNEKYELRLDRYVMNGNLAIMVWKDGEPFDTLTVNLGESLEDRLIYVDVNHWDRAGDFVELTGLAEPLLESRISGFVKYPLYLLDIENLKEEVGEENCDLIARIRRDEAEIKVNMNDIMVRTWLSPENTAKRRERYDRSKC